MSDGPSVPDGPFPPRPDQNARSSLRARLRAWYRRNARDLPWRRTRDPYAIWVSEAMLQQTRVEAVRDHYARFLGAFPTTRDLAQAGEDRVLAVWSGLGYYRRARAMHAAARAIIEHHGGRFPEDRASLMALPGIGRYTAGALLSIAFDRPEPLVDGNVERVFSRLFALDAPSGSPALTRECWALAESLVPRRGGAGEWNQALMELGATLCTPRSPRCGDCPLTRTCRAREQGLVEVLPRPRARTRPVAVELELALAERRGEVLLERRPGTGRMAGMWQLPTRECPGDGEGTGLFPVDWSAGIDTREVLRELRHSITRYRIRGVVLRATPRHARLPGDWAWVRRSELGEMALTGMTIKALESSRGCRAARAAPAPPPAPNPMKNAP
ncbi:MAG: A/G-specific adenine glycosylase [Planctomycetota bacterium]